VAGWANPELEEVPLEDAAALFVVLEEAATSVVPGVPGLAGHVRELSDAVRSADSTAALLVDRWFGDVQTAVQDLEPAPAERLRQLASISTFIERQQMTWLLVGDGGNDCEVENPRRVS
jgi:hypothetical protein